MVSGVDLDANDAVAGSGVQCRPDGGQTLGQDDRGASVQCAEGLFVAGDRQCPNYLIGSCARYGDAEAFVDGHWGEVYCHGVSLRSAYVP